MADSSGRNKVGAVVLAKLQIVHQNAELLCRHNHCLSARTEQSNNNLNKKGGLPERLLSDWSQAKDFSVHY